MATRNSVITQLGQTNSQRLVVWSGLLNTDDGSPLDFVDWADRCVQITGTFGVGGTVVLEGSNDGTNWATMTDYANVALSFTAPAVKQITEQPRFMRPRVTAGDGTTSLAVSILARKVNALL